ncbi:hypothetical protein ACJMK2_022802 [Sinanodonta woodiana]|uniref:Uncharacterized protein n=1 Tax=Sinanodonta woodiana TaxID=1069815 RepID=A0ABD3TLX5_SINWO
MFILFIIVVVKHVLNMTNAHARMEQQDIVTMLVSAIATIKRVSYNFVYKYCYLFMTSVMIFVFDVSNDICL